jgi:hypothetical protein
MTRWRRARVVLPLYGPVAEVQRVNRQNSVRPRNQLLRDFLASSPAITFVHVPHVLSLARTPRPRLSFTGSLLLENLALQQQLTALKRKHPKPKFRVLDKLFWVVAIRFWSGWKQSLILVTPETVFRRPGFRLYWSFISRARRQVGRKRLSKEVRDLIFHMVAENPTWGAPRDHGELRMRGFDVSERSISRCMQRAPRNPEPARSYRFVRRISDLKRRDAIGTANNGHTSGIAMVLNAIRKLNNKEKK